MHEYMCTCTFSLALATHPSRGEVVCVHVACFHLLLAFEVHAPHMHPSGVGTHMHTFIPREGRSCGGEACHGGWLWGCEVVHPSHPMSKPP